MKILLVSSYKLEYVSRTDISPPLSLLYLSAAVRDSGHEPILLDFNVLSVPRNIERKQYYLSAALETIAKENPGLLMINCFLTANFPFVRELAQQAKAHVPDIPVAIGGIHPTLFAKEIVENCPEIDFVVTGEGERQVAALANCLAEGRMEALRNIQGFVFRDKQSVVFNSQKDFVKDLDELPAPAWDLVKLEDYYTNHSDWYNPRGLDVKMSAPILSSRSCPYDCNFCSAYHMMGRQLRLRTPGKVVDEMEALYDSHGINYFGFVDDNLTLNRMHILGICNEILRRGMNIQFESFSGYNLASLDRDVIETMYAAGCVYAILPIEHGSDHMRNHIIGKRLPREKIYQIAEIYREKGIMTRGVFIMGFPEETNETLNDTMNMMKELALDMYNVFALIPFPGTRVFQQAVQDKLLLQDLDFTKMWTGENDLNAVKEDFYLLPYNMSVDELRHWRRRFDEMRLYSDRVRNLQEITSVGQKGHKSSLISACD